MRRRGLTPNTEKGSPIQTQKRFERPLNFSAGHCFIIVDLMSPLWFFSTNTFCAYVDEQNGAADPGQDQGDATDEDATHANKKSQK